MTATILPTILSGPLTVNGNLTGSIVFGLTPTLIGQRKCLLQDHNNDNQEKEKRYYRLTNKT